MKRKGQNLELFRNRIPRQFGGMLLAGNAKRQRPLSTKNALHLVLKSSVASGSRSFLQKHNAAAIDRFIRTHAARNGIRLYHLVNVGNHLHMVIRLNAPSALAGRRAFQRFIRTITGLIARHVLGAERGSGKGKKFWLARPFTRLVSWGRDYYRVSQYMQRNRSQVRWIDWGFSVTDPKRIELLETG